MAKRSHKNKKEYTELQQLKRENQELKRLVSRLRKQLTSKHLTTHNSGLEEPAENYLKESNKCPVCHQNSLERFSIAKMGVFYEYLKCNECGHSEKPKKVK